MLQGFEFPGGPNIAYGDGRVDLIGEDVKNISGTKKAVVVTDPGIVGAGLADVVLKALKKETVEAELFSGVRSDPTAESINEVVDVVKASGAKCVIGLGGGSPMDVAKAAAAIAGGSLSAEHYELMKNPFPAKTVKCIAIPTTSGTGAEVTRTVVFTNSSKHKVWAWDNKLTAEMAILEPAFTVGLPPHLTASTGLDALTHAIEACTNKSSNPVAQALGLQAIRMIRGNLEKAMARPDDIEVRGNLAVASLLAGMGFARASTGLAHSLGHALGSLGHIHHGRAVAICLNVIYAWNVEAAIAIHADIARAFEIKDRGQDEKELALAGAQEFDRLVKAVGLNTSLADDGLTVADCDTFLKFILSPENTPMRESNPRWATEEDLKRFVLEILNPDPDKPGCVYAARRKRI